MHRHRFDPLSAVLGVLAVTIGLLVATGSLRDAGADLGWWLAAGSLLVGVAIVPWRRADPPGEPDPD